MVGILVGTRSWFSNPNRKSLSSAHYGVGFNGPIDRYNSERVTAYHAGDYSINQQSIGIEFEDGGKPDEPRPDLLYQTGARLIADIATTYNLPLNRETVRLHREVSKNATACPGTLDVDRLIREAQAIVNPQPAIGGTGAGTGTVQLATDLFEFLVTTSRNFKDVAALFGYTTNEQINDPTLGARLSLEVVTLRKVIADQQAEIDRLRTEAQASKPEESYLDHILTPKPDLGTLPKQPPKQFELDKRAVDTGKSLFKRDILEVISYIKAIFWR